MKINTTIKKPVITEKSTNLASQGVYMFQIDNKATKHAISNTVENIYNVTVSNVKVINRKGKVKRVGKKFIYKRRPTVKYAYIKLKKGTINVFPQA